MGDGMERDEIWDGLDNEKNWDAEKYRAQTTLLAIEDFYKHWDRFNQDVLCRCYRNAKTPKDALERVGFKEIKLYLINRVQGSPKPRRGEGLRQSTVFGFFKTLHMVYSIDIKDQLQKATDGMFNNFIQGKLTEKFNLTKGIKDKATCPVRDLYLLHYNWCQDVAGSSHGRCCILNRA